MTNALDVALSPVLTSPELETFIESLSDEELPALAQLYQRLWLRQSEVLAEVVRRGLSAGAGRGNWVAAGWHPPD